MRKRKQQQRCGPGVGTIISKSSLFEKSLMEKILVKNILAEDFSKYYCSLKGIGKKIQEKFPLLKFTLLPTQEITLGYIKGELAPADLVREFGKKTVIKQGISFPIFAVIPMDYSVRGIKVYDACKRINQEKIPEKYKHFNGGLEICTHKPVDITPDNAVIDVLQSAWHLYLEYKKYEKTGRFDLECHAHGGNEFEN